MLLINDEVNLTIVINYIKKNKFDENKRYLKNIIAKYVKAKDINAIQYLLVSLQKIDINLYHYFAETFQNQLTTLQTKDHFYVLYLLPIYLIEIETKRNHVLNFSKEEINECVDKFINKNFIKKEEIKNIDFEYYYPQHFLSYTDLFFKDNLFYLPETVSGLINNKLTPSKIVLTPDGQDYVLFLPIVFKFNNDDVFNNEKFFIFNETLSLLTDSHNYSGLVEYFKTYLSKKNIPYGMVAESYLTRFNFFSFYSKIRNLHDHFSLKSKIEVIKDLERLYEDKKELACEIELDYIDNKVNLIFFNKTDKYNYPRAIIDLKVQNKEHAESSIQIIMDLLNEENISFTIKQS